MKYTIEWCAWDGDKEEIIDAENEAEALRVAADRWRASWLKEPPQYDAHPHEPEPLVTPTDL